MPVWKYKRGYSLNKLRVFTLRTFAVTFSVHLYHARNFTLQVDHVWAPKKMIRQMIWPLSQLWADLTISDFDDSHRFFLGRGGGRVKEGWGLRGEGHQWKWAPKGRAVPLCQLFKEGHTPFPDFLTLIFVTLLFLTDKAFLFTYSDLIWCYIICSRLHFYMYIMPWHIVISGDSCPFPSVSRRTSPKYRFFSFLLLSTIRCLISQVL